MYDVIEPDEKEKLWVIEQLSKFVLNGGGTFRMMLKALNLSYHNAYTSGGMIVSNALCANADSCPILRGQDSIDFSEKVAREESIPFTPIPTPKLEKLRREILRDAKRRDQIRECNQKLKDNHDSEQKPVYVLRGLFKDTTFIKEHADKMAQESTGDENANM